MPVNVFGNSTSNNSNKKIDTSSFVKKPYLKTNFIESNFEEDIHLRNQYRNKKLPDPISIRDACCKNYVDNLFNNPSIIKNTDQIDFNDKNLNNVHFIEVNSKPTLEEQLTPKIYVDQAILDGVNEPSLLRVDPDEKLNLDEQNSLVLLSNLSLIKTVIKLLTKFYVDVKFNDLSIIRNTAYVNFNNQNLDNVRFLKVNSLPVVCEHLTPKFYVDQTILFSVHESPLLILDPGEKLKLDEQDSINLNSTLTSPKTIVEKPTKSYVDSLHESSRNRRDLSSVFNDQDNEFDEKK